MKRQQSQIFLIFPLLVFRFRSKKVIKIAFLCFVILLSLAFLYLTQKEPKTQVGVTSNKVDVFDSIEPSRLCTTENRIRFDGILESRNRFDYLSPKYKLKTQNFKTKQTTNGYVHLNSTRGIKRNGSILGSHNFVKTYKQRKYYFAINLYNNEPTLPHIIAELLRVFDYLGFENIYLSLYENGSTDLSRNIISMFKNSLCTWRIKNTIIAEKFHKPKIWHRIEYLAQVRNKALKPLYIQAREGIKYDKIIFLNDSIFCRNDILELIYQSDLQQADITCPLDFDVSRDDNNADTIDFRDVWVARDLNGNSFRKSVKDIVSHDPSLKRANKKLPFQVQCCWNGAAVLNSEPFYNENPVRFRRSYQQYGECSASECSLVCNDFWEKSYRRVVVVPRILLSYEIPHFESLDNQLSFDPIPESELVEYTKGPDRIVCKGLNENNRIHPDQPAIWVKYTSNGTDVY